MYNPELETTETEYQTKEILRVLDISIYLQRYGYCIPAKLTTLDTPKPYSTSLNSAFPTNSSMQKEEKQLSSTSHPLDPKHQKIFHSIKHTQTDSVAEDGPQIPHHNDTNKIY